MTQSLEKIIRREKFNPSIIGFFINHNFNIRRLLYKNLKNNSSVLKGKVLDFGCGSKPYKHIFTTATEYIGVDYLIEGRTENIGIIDFYYDGKRIPFDNNTFDSVLCTEVLEHVFNLNEVLNELNRVLKPNGKAIITTPFMWEEHEMPYDFARYTSTALKHLYENHGFKVIDNKKSGNTVYVFFQFGLNYIKNVLPKNKLIKQIILLPFIFIFNFLGTLFGGFLPKDQTSYFNNIFILEKIE